MKWIPYHGHWIGYVVFVDHDDGIFKEKKRSESFEVWIKVFNKLPKEMVCEMQYVLCTATAIFILYSL